MARCSKRAIGLEGNVLRNSVAAAFDLDRTIGARALSLAVLVVAAACLAGCAGAGDGFASGAFVDPAKYELYDCGQLATERAALEARSVQLQGLIDKARTGTAGAVVGEVAYRNDYISTRASLKAVNEAWARGRCVASATPPAPAPASGPPGARRGGIGR